MDTVKLYFDYKSPFAYLAAAPAFALPERYAIELRWIPFLLRLKGPGQRSIYSDWKAQYSYMDARRWANRRGGFRIMGPLKIYDSTAALIGGLYAMREGFFRPYSDLMFFRFFERKLEIDRTEEVAAAIDELGKSGERYLAYAPEEGARAFAACMDEAAEDHVFGVPLFVLQGEQFWGQDRMPLLEDRLTELGLKR
jgi:2-hydroxychromene-2-carboxylate isomerase